MKLTNNIKPFVAIAGFALVAGSVHAASIAVGLQRAVSSQNIPGNGREDGAYYVSVNASNAAIAANNAAIPGTNNLDAPFQHTITEPIQSYRFVGSSGGSGSTLVDRIYSGGLISMSTTDTAFDSFQQGRVDLWTTNDPGPNLLTPATAQNLGPAGIRGISDVSGSIDISGLGTGTIYFFYGNYRGTPSITATMEDNDGPGPTIAVSGGASFHNGDFANNTEVYVASLTFVNDAGYDTVDYNFTGSNGRWDGIVLAGSAPIVVIPEPSSTALLGLGGLAFMMRRRR